MSHKLILIRHGKSVWNLKNIFTGWVDVELDVQGEQEARLAVDLIKNADMSLLMHLPLISKELKEHLKLF